MITETDFLDLPCLHSFLRYAMFGDELGGFCTSVLANDLMQAAHRADFSNRPRLHIYAAFLFNVLPEQSWGSRKEVDRWIEDRRREPLAPDCICGDYPEIRKAALALWTDRVARHTDTTKEAE